MPLAAGVALGAMILLFEHVVDGWMTCAVADNPLVPK